MNSSFRRTRVALLLCYGFASAVGGAFAGKAFAQAPEPLRVDPVLLGLPPLPAPEASAPSKDVRKEPAGTASSPSSEDRAKSRVDAKPGMSAEPVAEKPKANINPVESAEVEARPLETARPANTSATPPAKNEPIPQVAGSSNAVRAGAESVPQGAAAAPIQSQSSPNVTSAASTSTEPRSAPPVPATAAAKAPASQAASARSTPVAVPGLKATSVTSLEPLKVDPALLGLPPVTATASAPSSSSVASSSLPGGERDRQRRPYGPAGGEAADRLASSSDTRPPTVAATGPRDEEEVPDDLPALALRPSAKMETLGRKSDESRPVFLSAQRMGGTVDREFVAEGDAEVRKIGTVVKADRMTYWPIDDEVEGEGNVRLEQGEDLVTGPKMRLKIEDQIGFFDQPVYTFKRQPDAEKLAAEKRGFRPRTTDDIDGDWLNSGFETPQAQRFSNSIKMARSTTEAFGQADRINFEGENQVRLTNATYTTCSPDNMDWYAKTSDLKLDYDREVGEGKDGTIYFKDVPILYSPWLSFSLNNKRKSGLLSPSIGTSTDNGIEYSQPYYWNIAPNMDATIAPRLMTKRGVQLNNEFRYLNTAYGGTYQGEAHIEYLPNDHNKNGDNRYGLSLRHTQSTASGFSSQINYSKVSDDDYYTDLSSDIAATSSTQLLQQAVLSYGGGGWWSTTVNMQQYQTLQPDVKNPVREQYRLLPQITLTARKPDWNLLDASFLGQYTNFTRRDQVMSGVTIDGDSGRRLVAYPQLAVPYVTPGWYVTPKVGLNVRHYALSGQAAGTPNSISVTLPVFSVDSGMTFERTSNWFGRDYTQTLEPRLYYLNIPYKNQDDIPLFDTGLADFNFAQIFSENQFSSWDRLNNANQLTAAVTSRLLEPDSGNEVARAMVGQRYYFTRNKVGLTTTTTTDDNEKWDRSDFLAAFSGQILPKVYADAAWQYNLENRQAKRYSTGIRYQPAPGKVLNAAYRYNRDASAPIDQVDFSGQWPITGRWHFVGRFNYSFGDDSSASTTSTGSKDGRLIESIAGLEYNGGCWVVRGVFRRQALTQDNASTSFYVQLELNDFSRIGSDPLKLLKRNIQGYSLINQPGTDSGFDE